MLAKGSLGGEWGVAGGKGGGESCIVAFTDLHDVNTPTIAGIKPSM